MSFENVYPYVNQRERSVFHWVKILKRCTMEMTIILFCCPTKLVHKHIILCIHIHLLTDHLMTMGAVSIMECSACGDCNQRTNVAQMLCDCDKNMHKTRMLNSLVAVRFGYNLRLVIFKHVLLIDIVRNSREIATRHHSSLVTIGSGNGNVPSDNKPLPEPKLTQSCVAIWRHQATMS